MNWRRGLHYGLGCAVQRGVGLLVLPLTANWLSATAFGQLGLLTAIANGLGLVAALGLTETAQRYSGDQPALGQVQRLARQWGLIWLLLTPLWWLSPWLPAQLHWSWLSLLWLNLGASALLGLRLMLLRVADDSRQYLLTIACWSGLQVVLIATALLAEMGIIGLMLSGVSATALTLLLSARSWLQSLWSLPSLTSPQQTKLLRYALPLCATALLGLVFVGYERLWLASVMDIADFGRYALMAQLALLPVMLMEPYGLWWFPKRFALAQAQHQGRLPVAELKNALVQGANIGALWLTTTTMLIALLVPLVLGWLLPQHFAEGLAWLPLLLLISLWRQLAALFNFGVYFQDSGRLPLLINVSVAVPGILLIPLAATTLGIFATLWVLLALMVIRFGLFYLISQRLLWLPYQGRALLMALTLVHGALFLAPAWQWLALAVCAGLLWRHSLGPSASAKWSLGAL